MNCILKMSLLRMSVNRSVPPEDGDDGGSIRSKAPQVDPQMLKQFGTPCFEWKVESMA